MSTVPAPSRAVTVTVDIPDHCRAEFYTFIGKLWKTPARNTHAAAKPPQHNPRTTPLVTPRVPARGLAQLVTDHCTCLTCFHAFERDDRVPWRWDPSPASSGPNQPIVLLNAKHGRHTIDPSCNLCEVIVKLPPTRLGYIYKAPGSLQEAKASALRARCLIERQKVINDHVAADLNATLEREKHESKELRLNEKAKLQKEKDREIARLHKKGLDVLKTHIEGTQKDFDAEIRKQNIFRTELKNVKSTKIVVDTRNISPAAHITATTPTPAHHALPHAHTPAITMAEEPYDPENAYDDWLDQNPEIKAEIEASYDY